MSRIVRITLSNPPVNALNLATKQHILDEVEAALADDQIIGIVLLGSNGRFSGGADVREFNTPEAQAFPSIIDVGRVIEKSTKPVVAAIEGIALGGGLELAMFCHLRVADADAKLGLPEVSLGLLPGAGGTQRLPRLVGLERSIDWMIAGKLVSAAEAQAAGLVDEVAVGDVGDAAEALLSRHLAARSDLTIAITRPVVMPDDAGQFFETARNKARALGRGPAPEAIVDCVEAAATWHQSRPLQLN